MPGVTLERMKEGYSQIRNRALAHAFSYMNLIEGWGTGIPRLIHEMKEYGLREPEFIDMEIALRINLYRNTDFNMVSESIGFIPLGIVPESAGQLTKQQAIIYKRILDNGYVTSAEAEQLLDVKQRRARAILKNMSENGMIKKIGAGKNTRYII